MVGTGRFWCVAGRRTAPSGRVGGAAGAVVVTVPISVSVYGGTSVSIVIAVVVIVVMVVVGVLVSVGRLGTLVVDHRSCVLLRVISAECFFLSFSGFVLAACCMYFSVDAGDV